jgi:hypothetical protein
MDDPTPARPSAHPADAARERVRKAKQADIVSLRRSARAHDEAARLHDATADAAFRDAQHHREAAERHRRAAEEVRSKATEKERQLDARGG